MYSDSTNPSELRAMIAQHWRRPLYQLAARASIHPCRLSSVLHERAPLSQKLAIRILDVLREEREWRSE